VITPWIERQRLVLDADRAEDEMNACRVKLDRLEAEMARRQDLLEVFDRELLWPHGDDEGAEIAVAPGDYFP
jgi:hypothetical protein